MVCDTIKYKIVKNLQTNDVELEIYRPYGNKTDEWVMIDKISDLSLEELKCLTEYLISVWKKKN